jgi:hypothetical protein
MVSRLLALVVLLASAGWALHIGDAPRELTMSQRQMIKTGQQCGTATAGDTHAFCRCIVHPTNKCSTCTGPHTHVFPDGTTLVYYRSCQGLGNPPTDTRLKFCSWTGLEEACTYAYATAQCGAEDWFSTTNCAAGSRVGGLISCYKVSC